MNRPRATAALLVAALALAGAGAAQADDTSAGARKLAPVKAARIALAHFRALQGGQSGTTLSASVTAAAHNGGTATWTISKSVDEDTLDLETGESDTVHYTITVTKTPGSGGAFVDVEVCVENGGPTSRSRTTPAASASRRARARVPRAARFPKAPRRTGRSTSRTT